MSSGGEKIDGAGRLRKEMSQQGKKEVGEAGREDGIQGEEDKRGWGQRIREKERDSRGGSGGRGQGD